MPLERVNFIRDIGPDELQIIGVEFTVSTYSRNQELAMFVPQVPIIIPRLNSGRHREGDQYFPAITFHSTDGDYQINTRNGGYAPCPW